MKEEAKYLVIIKLMGTKDKKRRADIRMALSKRQIKRMIVGLKLKLIMGIVYLARAFCKPVNEPDHLSYYYSAFFHVFRSGPVHNRFR